MLLSSSLSHSCTIILSISDEFGVVNVVVTISDDQGNPFESGEAVETAAGSGQWIYTAVENAEADITVQVAATDRPGGMAVLNVRQI